MNSLYQVVTKRVEELKVAAWPKTGVRRAESLWMLTRRFIWLNLPSRADMKGVIPYGPYGLSLLLRNVTRHQFAEMKLRQCLPLSHSQWLEATLDEHSFRRHIYSDIRFCGECLMLGYHTVIFQLRFVSRCPLHHCELIRGCPRCGAHISSELTKDCFNAPFACPKCRFPWTTGELSVDPPPIDCCRSVKELIEWCSKIAKWPRIESFPPEDQLASAFLKAPNLALLGLATGDFCVAETDLVGRALDSSELMRAQCRYVGGEQGACPSFHMKPTRSRRLYRMFLYSVARFIPESDNLLDTFRRFSFDGVINGKPASSLTMLLGLILFRYTMEAWGSPFSPNRGGAFLAERSSARSLTVSFRTYDPYVSELFRCSDMEFSWLFDRIVLEDIRGVFAASQKRAKTMAELGDYRLEDVYRSGIESLPFPICLRNREGRLEFWSLRARLDQRWKSLDRRLGLSSVLDTDSDV